MDAYNKHIAANKQVEFIHVSMDDDKAEALDWAKKAKLPWLHILHSELRATGMQAYDQGGVPQYYLIDKNGRILASNEMQAFEKIKELTK